MRKEDLLLFIKGFPVHETNVIEDSLITKQMSERDIF